MKDDVAEPIGELTIPDTARIEAALKGEEGQSVAALIREIETKARAKAKTITALDTVRARDDLKSVAFKVTQSKTAIDGLGKQMNAGLRAKIDEVDAQRRLVRSSLDDLRDEIRQPLDEWQKAEDARIEKHEANLGRFSVDFTAEDPAGAIAQEISAIENIEIDDSWEEFEANARAAKAATLDQLRRAHAAAQAREELEAENERLRQEAAKRAERERKEAEERAAREAEERAERERQEAEARAAREKAEAVERKRQAEENERLRREAEEARQAAEAARAEAERMRREEEERQRREAEAERERKDAEAAEAQLAKIRAQQERQAKASKKAQAERRKRLTAEIAKSICGALDGGMFEPVEGEAENIAAAIYDGKIRHVRIEEDAE